MDLKRRILILNIIGFLLAASGGVIIGFFWARGGLEVWHWILAGGLIVASLMPFIFVEIYKKRRREAEAANAIVEPADEVKP